MCLILFAFKAHPKYPLIVAANRDEFYQRKTLPVHWWKQNPDLLAGKDLEAGGTWMGVNRNGNFAAVTNIREPDNTVANPLSRGQLPHSYLTTNASADDFACGLINNGERYQGFNLLFGNSDKLYYLSNRGCHQELGPGIYGLSNAQLNTPWPKVTAGKQNLAQKIKKATLDTNNLLKILTSKQIAADDQLPQTGVSLKWERLLSATCISAPEYGYGTRSSSVLLINHQGMVLMHERTVAPDDKKDTTFEFQL